MTQSRFQLTLRGWAEAVRPSFVRACTALLDLEKLKGNVHGLLRKLRSVLRADLQVVQNMFRAWDANGSFHVTYNEFADALAALGFSSKKELTRAIFDELDDDASFTLGFREFKAWLFSSDEEFERRLLD